MADNKICAMIERGKVQALKDGGYEVLSLDRDGIVTLPIRGIDGSTYRVNDTVYYFVFPDGTGKIICPI